MEDFKTDVSVSSRLQYIDNPKAKRVADFILGYSFRDKELVYSNGIILVPLYRVLDALAMIDKDGIRYCET